MSNYVFGTSLRYVDYLQAESFENSLRSEISSSSRRIIASNEELAREHISVLGSMSSAMKSGFEQLSSDLTSGFDQLSYDLNEISDHLAELNSTFQWGFSEVLTQLGGLNDSLHELIKIAKTPAQTWAYEQFEIARDAFRQELYDEAIQCLNRAINGHGDQTGYSLEYRFHFLLGTIRIGSFKNHSNQIVDPQQAEQAFLNAAKYARHDHPKEAARSFLGAGWAAYCQGKMQDAERHTREAVTLDNSLAEAHFQLAKVQMHHGHPDAALIPLKTAITLDRGYTIKACSDGDFTPYQQEVNSLIETLRQEARQNFESCLEVIESDISDLEKCRAKQFSLADDTPIAAARNVKDEVRHTAAAGTYYGYLDALKLYDSAELTVKRAREGLRYMHQQRLAQIKAERRQRAQQELAARIAKSEKGRRNANLAMKLSLWSVLLYPLAIVGIIIGIQALSQFKHGQYQHGKGKAIVAVLIGSFLLLGLCCLIVYSIIKSRH